ncbi:exonuclease V a 5' deoxyribonuclease-domain-containing protein [Gymnopilus junonius]|uniref:Exonuclease V a 5' deoxyribonuclease-domain-containing protein n=1 Tax=Gymnopilus junonius TaxID=109634 RepID=A0A9P5TSU0_GYMJU|nr:exonuclease V a 5' deoxyribonuclease-domain-containing protein [Gymnopilus junonius]
MSDLDPDDSFPGHNLSDFTEEDFAQIDAAIASASRAEGPPGKVSFQSDLFDLNLRTLTAEDFERLDNDAIGRSSNVNGGPSVQIEIEDTTTGLSMGSENILDENMNTMGPAKAKLSPLAQFRLWTSLSVTDLVSPAWCEVQYDYGLRGRRSRPINKRPKSFTSSSGKTISPEVSVVQKNDVRTKQGLAVHKQLEREIKFDELKVDITTEETRWALRLVNMLACLQGVLDGFTREMPVFGILHGEVVVGIMVCTTAKRARTDSSSQTLVDSFFKSPKKSAEKLAAVGHTPSPNRQTGYILCIKDHKTRNRSFLPSEPDMYPSRLQLMVYRRLFSELVARDPPYDFTALWETLGIDSKLIFPTNFLVQAQLIRDTTDFPSTCLDDLVASWHRLLEKSNILGVDTTLELIYHLRPPDDSKGKRKAKAVESSTSLGHEAESSNATADGDGTKESHNVGSEVLLKTENIQLQWALQQSVISLSSSKPSENPDLNQDASDGDGIHHFKIIGHKRFLFDAQVLDNHLTHVMKWWRGQREPEGVAIDRTYRCRTCEYANDCEWRAQKALELSRKCPTTSCTDVAL